MILICTGFRKGYVTLVTILIIVTVLLTLLISSQIVVTSGGESTLVRRLGIEAYEVADSCLEDTLIRLRSDISHTGGNLNLAGGYCTISVVDSSAGEKTVTIQASVLGSYYANMTVVVTYVQDDQINRLELQSLVRN